jgi:ABC-type transporter Mla maintaining outer membrane lipid asymmetry ATPase subunit MlaF
MEDAPLDFTLGCGARYAILSVTPVHAKAILAQLPAAPTTVYVPPDGGLISNLRIGENVILPATYHTGLRPEQFQKSVATLFSTLGYDQGATSQLLAKLPADLSKFEKRLIGFARAAIQRPAVIVYESLWTGLSAREFEQVIAFDGILRADCPAAISIFLHSGTSIPFDVTLDRTFVL